MCWHFWKCKQMLRLWISTSKGLKSIHSLKSRCTKAFKSYGISARQKQNSPSFCFKLGSLLTYLTFALNSHLYCQTSCRYTFIYVSSHILSQNDAPWEKREEKALQHREASHKEQQLCASVVHNRWNRSRCSSEAPRYHDTYCTTQKGKKMTETHSCAHSQNHKHRGTYGYTYWTT